MSSLNFSSGDKVAQAIDKRIIAIAKQVANKSTVNRTVFGRVTAKNNGLFSLRINNTVYTNVIALKNSNYINVGDKVVCLVPNNQFNDLLILGVADGSLLATSEYTLNQASSTELGGIKANNRTVEDQEVRIDPNTGFLYYSLGKSIASIEKTSTSGLVDTYTITYTDGTYTTFTVTNADQIDIQYVNGQLQWKYASETTWTTLFTVDNAMSTTSANPIQNQVVTNAINNKIDINQGVSNVGKVLTVGSDGNVLPQAIPSSGGTVVNINNVPQSTVNFSSDPQTQIDNLNNKGIAVYIDEGATSITQEQLEILQADDSNYIVYGQHVFYVSQIGPNNSLRIYINTSSPPTLRYIYISSAGTLEARELDLSYILENNEITTTTTTQNVSSNTNNYVRIGNNLLIQWGHAYCGRDTNMTLTFGYPFADANYSIVVMNGDSSAWAAYLNGFKLEGSEGGGSGIGKTSTGCTITQYNYANNFEWIAIGRWE